MDDAPTSPQEQIVSRRGGERTVSQRTVAFRCAWCGEPVVELRYPGPTPAYGQACTVEARRYANAAKAARRRGSPVPARVVTTSCKGSPTNLHDANSVPEPPQAELVVRAPSEAAVRAALALLQFQLDLPPDATPVITSVGVSGWEATLSLALPPEPPAAEKEPPPANVAEPVIQDDPLAASEDILATILADIPDETDEEVLSSLAYELDIDRKGVAGSIRMIDGVLRELEGGAALGLRRGKLLLRELEGLIFSRQRLAVQQVVVDGGMTTGDAINALARETAIAGEITRRQVERSTEQLTRERGLRGASRAAVIALAVQLRDEVRALAEAVGIHNVTDAAIARAIWEAWHQLDHVETWDLALPGDDDDPPEERKSLPHLYDGPVAAISLNGSAKRHLTEGRFDTLCGLPIEGEWQEEKAFRRTDCKRCRKLAMKRWLVCVECRKPLLKQELPGLCPTCSRQQLDWRSGSIHDPAPFPQEPRRSSRRKRPLDDMDALFMLDDILAQERAIEQRYNLPFRAPHQTAAVAHTCTRCGQPLLFLIFGDRATDAVGLDAYGRLMEQHIKQNGVPAYVLGKADGEGDDAVSLLRRVWPDHSEVVEMTGNRWEAFLEEQSQAHGCADAADPS